MKHVVHGLVLALLLSDTAAAQRAFDLQEFVAGLQDKGEIVTPEVAAAIAKQFGTLTTDKTVSPKTLGLQDRPRCTIRLGGLEIPNAICSVAAAQDNIQLSTFSFLWLQAHPLIRLSVQPDPPKDYAVRINGTELAVGSSYRVLAGNVVVEVSRAGQQPCVWKEIVKGPAERLVECKFKPLGP
jgi:hypothetical protein